MGHRNNFGPTIANHQNKPEYMINTLNEDNGGHTKKINKQAWKAFARTQAWKAFDRTLSAATTRPTIAPPRVYGQMQTTQNNFGPHRIYYENVNRVLLYNSDAPIYWSHIQDFKNWPDDSRYFCCHVSSSIFSVFKILIFSQQKNHVLVLLALIRIFGGSRVNHNWIRRTLTFPLALNIIKITSFHFSESGHHNLLMKYS